MRTNLADIQADAAALAGGVADLERYIQGREAELAAARRVLERWIVMHQGILALAELHQLPDTVAGAIQEEVRLAREMPL